MASNQDHIETKKLVDHLFRHEAGRMVSMLTRVFGIDRIDLAEDVVQEALLKALQQWRFGQIPDNPSAWLMRVAKNQALDVLRREQSFTEKQESIAGEIEQPHSREDGMFDEEIRDDQLRMMFACCHPSIPPDSQIALTLKTLCGFSVTEIAKAFLTNEETIYKRLTRAKEKLREERIALEIPAGLQLASRRLSVLRTLYLLFNEGYKASHGEELVRRELCEEAIYLTRVLTEHSVGTTPAAYALLALMLLHAARFPARVNDDGSLLLLRNQDRSLWDQRLIAEGLRYLDLSASGEELTEYHLQAGIAACHCLAKSYEETNWKRILQLYDLLVGIDDSPIVLLNRAVAVAQVHGPEEGVRAVEELRGRKSLEGYHLLYAVLGEFYFELRRYEDAAQNFRRALQLTTVQAEQLFLSKKLEDILNIHLNYEAFIR
jgi:RNA polymerase sigma-70 factor (ECF subfamily)